MVGLDLGRQRVSPAIDRVGQRQCIVAGEGDRGVFPPRLVDPLEPENRQPRRLPAAIAAAVLVHQRDRPPGPTPPNAAAQRAADRLAIDLEVVADGIELSRTIN